MNSRLYTNITPKIAESVLQYFYTNNDNRSTVIAKALGIKLHYVDYIIDIDLKYKRNSYVDLYNSIKYESVKRTKLKVYEADTLIGSYTSYVDAEKDLKLPKHIIYKYLQNGLEINTRYHTKLKKTYTYVKVI